MSCGNGSDRTQHPFELFGEDWLDWGSVLGGACRTGRDYRPMKPQPSRQGLQEHLMRCFKSQSLAWTVMKAIHGQVDFLLA